MTSEQCRASTSMVHSIRKSYCTVEVFTIEPVSQFATAVSSKTRQRPSNCKRIFGFCLLCAYTIVLTNPMFFFVARLDVMTQYYERSPFIIHILSVSYFVLGIGWPLIGLRIAYLIGNEYFLLIIYYIATLGFWIRCESTAKGDGGYVIALTAQFIIAFAHAFLSVLSPRMITEWFPQNHRLPMTVYRMVYKAGILGSYIVPIFSFGNVDDPEKTETILYWNLVGTAALGTTLFFFFLIGTFNICERKVRENPKILSSLSHNLKESRSLLMIMYFGLYGGSFYAFLMLLGIFASFKNKNDLFQRWSGIVCLSAYLLGSLTCIAMLRFTDRTKSYLILTSAGCLLVTVAFSALLQMREESTLLSICGILGWFYGIISEVECLNVTIRFKDDRSVAAATVFSASQMFAVILFFAGSKLFERYHEMASWLLTAFLVPPFFITVFWQVNLKKRVLPISPEPQQSQEPQQQQQTVLRRVESRDDCWL